MEVIPRSHSHKRRKRGRT